MKVHYSFTVTTEKCPSCGKILKQHDESLYFVIKLLFFPVVLVYYLIYFFYYFAIKILSEHILHVSIPKVGNPYMTCPRCGQKILTGKEEYTWLEPFEKLCYDNRGLIRMAYFCGGTLFISFILSFFRFSKNESNAMTGKVASIIFIVCLVIIILITIYWKCLIKEEAKKTVEPSNDSISTVSEVSQVSTRHEGLSSLLNYSDVNFDFTESDLKNINSDVEYHTKENLSKFFMQFKEKKDDIASKDIAFTLVYMYARQDKLIFVAKDKEFPIVNTAFGRYLPVYTDQKYVNDLLGNRCIEEETKRVFEIFYLLNTMNKCEGIVFNYGTDSMLLLPKFSIDHIGFDIVFDVPWKEYK